MKRFGKELCINMKKAALHQIEKGSKKSKEAGEYAMSDAFPESLFFLNSKSSDNDMVAGPDIADEGEPLKNLHHVAWGKMLTELTKIKGKHAKKANSLEIAEIIKNLCPELIQQCRELAIMMKEDFNYN